MAEDHPAARAALQHYPPLAALHRLPVRLLAAGRRRAGPEFVVSFFLDEQRAGPGDVEALGAADEVAVLRPQQKAVADAEKRRLRRRQGRGERRQHGRQRRVVAIAQHPEAVERARNVAPGKGAAGGLVFGDQTGADEAEECRKGAAVRPGPGDRRRRAGIVLPIRRRRVFVGEELPQDQERRAVVLGAFLLGRVGHVPREMRGDDTAAAMAERRVPAEIVPAALAFAFLDQMSLGLREIRKEQCKAGKHRARLEIEILDRGLFVGVERLEARELLDDLVVGDRDAGPKLAARGSVRRTGTASRRARSTSPGSSWPPEGS